MLDRLAPGVRVVTPPGHRIEIGSRGPFGERFPMLPDRKENLSRLMGRGGCGCLLAIVATIALVGVLDLILKAL